MEIVSSIEKLTDNVMAIIMLVITAYWITKNINVPEVWYGFLGMVIAYYFQKKK